jgi:transposase, IS30 family
MGQGLRRGFGAAEKAKLWDCWQRGESLKAIGRAFGKPSSSIYFQLAPHGGIRLAPRRRSRLALTLVEREEISRGIAAAETARSMARKLGRSPSTVAREISRNGGYDHYRASQADETAWVRARRPKRCKLADNPHLAPTGCWQITGRFAEFLAVSPTPALGPPQSSFLKQVPLRAPPDTPHRSWR